MGMGIGAGVTFISKGDLFRHRTAFTVGVRLFLRYTTAFDFIEALNIQALRENARCPLKHQQLQ